MFTKKKDNNNNILEKSDTKAKHEPSDWAMFTKCSFDEKENKLYYYKEKDGLLIVY